MESFEILHASVVIGAHVFNNNNNLLISNAQVSTLGFSNARYKEQNVYNIN